MPGKALVLLLLGAILFVVQQTTASTIFDYSRSYCPECSDFAGTHCVRSTRTVYGTTGSFSCQQCANSSNPLKMTTCNSPLGSTSSYHPCTSLLSDATNCGVCGKFCATSHGFGSTCQNGVCQCTLSSCYDKSSGKSYCSSTSTNCESCPAGFGTCGSLTGAEADCSVDLLSSTSTCGDCETSCSYNADTCSDGVCMCGTNAKCPDEKPFCVGGTCVACTTSSQCSQGYANPSNPSQFCETDAKACKNCPAGKASCNSMDDTGVAEDCETDVLQSGNVANCGACGVVTDSAVNAALTCCAGIPKCGKFTNSSAPTTDECEAASSCGENSYCDADLMECVPFGGLRNYKANCARAASNFNDYNTLLSVSLCGSCNATVSKSNVATIISNSSGVDVPVQTCLQSDSMNCGAVGNVCEMWQSCVMGECVCRDSTSEFLTYNSFREIDPEVTSELKNNAAPGCSSENPEVALFNGFSVRSRAYMASILDCAAAAEVKEITYAAFSDKVTRDNICNGDLNRCNATFCDSLVTKSLRLKDEGFCSRISSYYLKMADCAINYKASATAKPDPTCRDKLIADAAEAITPYPRELDFSLFFGCDFVNDLPGFNSNFSLTVDLPLNGYRRYHLALTKKLMGSAAVLKAGIAAMITMLSAALLVA